MSRFSLGVIGSRVMTWADGYGVDLVLGALMPAALIGFYRMGGRLNAALASILVFAPWQAQLAYLGERFRKAPQRAGTAMRRALQLHMSLIAPLFAGLAVASHDLIALLLGPAWKPAGDVLTIMALGSVAQVLWGVLIAAFVATGRSQRMFVFNAGVVGATTAALAFGALWGIQGAALGKFTVAAALYVAGLFLIAELRRADLIKIVGFFARMALCIGALVAAMLLAGALAPQGNAMWALSARIGIEAIAGLGAYLAALRLIAPEAARQLLFVARKRLRGVKTRRAEAPGSALPLGS